MHEPLVVHISHDFQLPPSVAGQNLLALYYILVFRRPEAKDFMCAAARTSAALQLNFELDSTLEAHVPAFLLA